MAMNFDPMTGQPMNQEGQRFDPMTGQPIVQNSTPKFDPMTGQPIFDDGGYQQTGKKKSSKALPWILAGVAGLGIVALAGGIGVWAATSGALLSAPNKVALAAYNTLTDSNPITKDIGDLSVLSEDKVTLEAVVNSEEVDMEVVFAASKKEKQVSAVVDVPGFGDIEAIAGLDDEYLKLQIPTFSDDVIAYNYVDEKHGFLVDNVDAEVIDMLDEALAMAYQGESDTSNEEFAKALVEAVQNQYGSLEFEKVDKEEFEVNGKDVKCKGYAVSITEDVVVDMIDEVGEVIYDYYGDEIDDLLAAEGLTWYDVIDEMVYGMEGMPDMDVTFYVYKNKLASIILEIEEYDGTAEILFLGGDYRMQNMEIVADGETVVEIEGEKDGSEECIVVSSQGMDLMEFCYDTKDGLYSFDIAGELYLEGTIESSNKEFRLNVDELIVEGSNIGSGSISVQKGAEFTEMDGELFDIGNASESELQSYLMEYSELLGMAY